jgi:hypothetical protein
MKIVLMLIGIVIAGGAVGALVQTAKNRNAHGASD